MHKGRVLVTGAAGFIAAAISRRLVSMGFDIVTIDNLSTGCEANIPQGVEFVRGDVHDEALIRSLEGVEWSAILHLAGQSSGEVSFDDPVYDLQSNVQSTLLLLKLALKTGCKRFLYASSMGVYGTQPDEAILESATTFPRSFYAVSKLSSEHYMRLYSEHGLNTVALRLFNVYGPGQNMTNMRQGMISIYLSQAMNSGAILVKGDKARFRDMVFIDDVVDAWVKALSASLRGFCVYNVCTGRRTTVEEVVTLIQRLFPGDIPVTYSGSTAGDQFGIYGSCGKIHEELGWAAQTALPEGLRAMFEWAKITSAQTNIA